MEREFDLKKMAQNGYGHWLRVQIPKEEAKIENWEREKRKLEAKIETLHWLIDFHSNNLQKSKKDLRTIEAQYKEVEPIWEGV